MLVGLILQMIVIHLMVFPLLGIRAHLRASCACSQLHTTARACAVDCQYWDVRDSRTLHACSARVINIELNRL